MHFIEKTKEYKRTPFALLPALLSYCLFDPITGYHDIPWKHTVCHTAVWGVRLLGTVFQQNSKYHKNWFSFATVQSFKNSALHCLQPQKILLIADAVFTPHSWFKERYVIRQKLKFLSMQFDSDNTLHLRCNIHKTQNPSVLVEAGDVTREITLQSGEYRWNRVSM